jgi:uncharacterized membrane protein
MFLLILGLILFLGTHSVRIVAEDWRMKQYARLGEGKWKGLYTLASLIGFALIVVGYGQARAAPIDLWQPPVWTRHLAVALMWPSFVLFVGPYLRGTNLKRWAGGHPMLLGTKIWAFGHLIANGRLADVLLFGAFLAWAALDFRACRQRDRVLKVTYPEGSFGRDAIAVVIGTIVWAVFAKWLHAWLIGVAPLG